MSALAIFLLRENIKTVASCTAVSEINTKESKYRNKANKLRRLITNRSESRYDGFLLLLLMFVDRFRIYEKKNWNKDKPGL